MPEPMKQIIDRSVGGRRWFLKSPPVMAGMALSQRFNVSLFIGQLLASYGLTADDAPVFLNPTIRDLMPDPFHLHDMKKACDRLSDAIESKEPIGLFGDYDVDGATSTAVLVGYLKNLNVPVFFHIPDRIEEGYGPNLAAFLDLKSKGCNVIITLDCGTTAFEVLEAAADSGLDVIVIDHHGAMARLPTAVAVVNPNRLDQDSPLQHLAAVGVTFMVLAGLTRTLKNRGFFDKNQIVPPNLLGFLDLVALGTVCDVVPLTGLNRAFVRGGLKILSSRRHIGLRALSDVSGVSESMTPYHLGFLLGPRINAGGRVGQASMGAQLLTTSDPITAASLATQLDVWNGERRVIEQSVLESAMIAGENQKDDSFLVVWAHGWHPGVIGIVAGRLKEHYHKPCFVITVDDDGRGKGSGRSIMGVDLGSWVQEAQRLGLITQGGGHKMAAGLSMNQDRILDLKDFFNAKMATLNLDLTPHLTICGHLTLESLTHDFMDHLDKLEPFGQGNPAPRFLFSHIRIAAVQGVGENHLRCTLKGMGGKTIEAMAFRTIGTAIGDYLTGKTRHDDLHAVVGTVKINRWMGQEKIQIMLDDIAPMSHIILDSLVP